MNLFVTGTDTEVGKTRVAAALLHAFAARRLRTVGMKPVAAGCDAQGLNEDVETLCAASSVKAPREWVCPYLFQPPIAPHIAAAEAGVTIDLAHIEARYRELRTLADVVIVEGVGGWLVPLNARETGADLARRLGAPVVLVVGMRLGCINHALLTQEAILARGLRLAGWVANRVDPDMQRTERNLEALRERLQAPLLADFPYAPGTASETFAGCFDLSLLNVPAE
ncbi:MAG: dethiobiotin synthase [Burkholderiales bacterium]|nr:dethiobiotin synthase [Burkholderiales bacterium]PZN04657.1 MAG: dethiobiotin synthase [Pseudomonadota bacterium]